MRWDNDKTLKFIKALELEEIIWNPKHPSHKDRALVYDAWSKLSKQFGYSVRELKLKKEIIFGTYRKLARRRIIAQQFESGPKEIRSPSWFLYEHVDQFLNSVYAPSFNNKKRPKRTTDECESEDSEIDIKDSFLSIPQNNCTEDQQDLNSSNEAQISFNPTPMYPAQLTDNGQIENQMEKTLSSLEAAVNELSKKTLCSNLVTKASSKTISTQTNSSQADRLELFAKLLLLKLQRLDEDTQDRAMFEIDNYMFGLRNQLIDREVQQTHSPVSKAKLNSSQIHKSSSAVIISQPSLSSHLQQPSVAYVSEPTNAYFKLSPSCDLSSQFLPSSPSL